MGVFMIDTLKNDDVETLPIKARIGVEALAAAIRNFGNNRIDNYKEMVKALHRRGSYNYASKKLSLDLKNRTTPMT